MADTTCLPYLDRLPLYVAGHLSIPERASLDAHLAACADCQRELAFWRAIPGALAALDDDIPPDTHAAMTWNALQQRLPPHPRPAVPVHIPRERAFMENESPRPSPSSLRTTAPATHRTRRPLLAAAACALIVALSVTLFGILGSQPHHPGVAGKGTATTATSAGCASAKLRSNLPANASLADLSMVSPKDGWAAGQVWDAQHPATPPHTLLMRFQSCAWSPVDASIPGAALTSISMGSSGNGWAVGMTLKSFPYQNADGTTNYQWIGDQLIVLHYSGGAWQRVRVPGNQAVIGAQVRMVSSSEGWMVLHGGKSHTGPDTIAYAETVLHYTGGAWSVVPHDAGANPSAAVSDFTGGDAGDLWTAGDQLVGAGNYDYAVLAHYHGGTWATRTDISGALTGVSFSSPTNGWAVGNTWNASYTQSVPLILHYDGTQWTAATLPASLRSANGAFLTSVTAVSDSEAWAFGSPGPSGGPYGPNTLALHYISGQWTAVNWPLTTTSAPHDLAMYSTTQGFALGNLAQPPSGGSYAGPKGVILALDNGSWSILPGQ